jgi:mannan endo-1,4-beta-mannosidase
MGKSLTWLIVAVLFVSGMTGRCFSKAGYPGFYVDGKDLFDQCGEKIVLRGTNAMTLYWDGYGGNLTTRTPGTDSSWKNAGAVTFGEIAKTGANCVRIFWVHHHGDTQEGWMIPAYALDHTLANCIANNMIPMPMLHNATGKGAVELDSCTDYWCRPEIAAVIKKYEQFVLLNIANEVNVGTGDAFVKAYAKSIKRIREAGIHTPLIIDGGDTWSQNETDMLSNASALLSQDPDANLVFSWHLYESVNCGSHPGTPQRVKDGIDLSIAKNVCMIFGEFSWVSGHPGCETAPVAWETILDYSQQRDIGWLVWTWWCCSDGGDPMSLSYNKLYGSWSNTPFGEKIAVSSPNSIKNTSKIPQFMIDHSCQKCTGSQCRADSIAQALMQRNLVFNGGFEADLGGWMNWTGMGEVVTASAQIKQGAKALHIKSGTAASGLGQELELEPSTSYQLSAWGKNAVPSKTSTDVGAKVIPPGGTEIDYVLSFTTETEYAYKELRFTTPEKFTGPLFFIWKSDASVDFYLDSIELKKTAAFTSPAKGYAERPRRGTWQNSAATRFDVIGSRGVYALNGCRIVSSSRSKYTTHLPGVYILSSLSNTKHSLSVIIDKNR